MSFPVGAALDPSDRLGLSGLAVRMLKRGCPGLSEGQIDERLDELGAEVETGAGLRSSWLACEMLTRSVPDVVDLLRRMLADPHHNAKPLGRLQRETVAEVIESRNDDASLAGRALRRSLFAGHPHERFPLGTTTTVPRVELSDLRAHHSRHYGRKTTIFAFSGDITDERAARIAESLAEVLPPENESTPPPREPAPRATRHFTLVDKGGRHQTQLALGVLGTKPHDEDHTALCVANTAFGGTFTSRLMQEIRAKRGWSYGASSQLHASTVREAFSCSAAPAANDAAACLALMVKLIDDWRNDGLNADELEFCKAYLRRSYAFEVDTPKKRVQRKLHNMLLGFAPDYDAHYLERLAEVTLAGANDAVRRRIDPTALCIAAVASEEEQGSALREALVGLGTSDVLAADFE